MKLTTGQKKMYHGITLGSQSNRSYLCDVWLFKCCPGLWCGGHVGHYRVIPLSDGHLLLSHYMWVIYIQPYRKALYTKYFRCYDSRESGQHPGAGHHPPLLGDEDSKECLDREPGPVWPLPVCCHHAADSGEREHWSRYHNQIQSYSEWSHRPIDKAEPTLSGREDGHLLLVLLR